MYQQALSAGQKPLAEDSTSLHQSPCLVGSIMKFVRISHSETTIQRSTTYQLLELLLLRFLSHHTVIALDNIEEPICRVGDHLARRV